MADRTFIESRAEIEEILREETLGFLGLAVEDVYVVPVTYCYSDGRIYLHGAQSGRKLELLRENERVCFTVARQTRAPVRHEGVCETDSASVICSGVARVIEDPEQRRQALEIFTCRFSAEPFEITLEQALRCTVVEISIAEMTARVSRDGEQTYMRHRFSV